MQIIILNPDEETFSAEQKEALAQLGSVVYKSKIQPLSEIEELKSSEDKILALDPDFMDWSFTKENIEATPNLKAICVQSTSFSWVDTEYAKTKNIPVTNTRNFSTEGVAEYALMMTLALARKLPLLIKNEYRQDVNNHKGVELKDKKVGVVGLGHIGARFAELCQGIGMEICYWSRTARDERFQLVELSELFKNCDVIFPAMAANDESKHLITDELVRTMKSTAMMVSITHKIYNHDLVVELAANQKIYGYAFEEDNGDPRKYKGNTLSFPSLGWATDNSKSLNAKLWTESIINAAKNSFPTQVN